MAAQIGGVSNAPKITAARIAAVRIRRFSCTTLNLYLENFAAVVAHNVAADLSVAKLVSVINKQAFFVCRVKACV